MHWHLPSNIYFNCFLFFFICNPHVIMKCFQTWYQNTWHILICMLWGCCLVLRMTYINLPPTKMPEYFFFPFSIFQVFFFSVTRRCCKFLFPQLGLSNTCWLRPAPQTFCPGSLKDRADSGVSLLCFTYQPAAPWSEHCCPKGKRPSQPSPAA